MPEGNEFKVEILACPACGGQIGGSGNCPSCGQLNVVTKNHKMLSITDKDVEGITIKAPSKGELAENDDPNWTISGWQWNENSLIVLSGGEPEYGAKMVALYLKKHPKEDLPGMLKPSIEKIEEFTLVTAIKQSR